MLAKWRISKADGQRPTGVATPKGKAITYFTALASLGDRPKRAARSDRKRYHCEEFPTAPPYTDFLNRCYRYFSMFPP
ncbi:hypothetical protein H6F96_08800 [Microcoleus sp. FACHB-53]|nr:hypothetical protein [Microcoleus sp. FACHB-53]